MIKIKTVLILGAGASNPFGYPTGIDLVKQILNGISSSGTPLLKFLQNAIEDEHVISDFAKALRLSGRNSIDRFLEYQPQYLYIGKLAIAFCLIQCEIEGNLSRLEDNWYRYLFERLNTTIDKIPDNNISIVTFNYDRSLEHFLYNAISNSYGTQKTKHEEILNKLRIIHVYGQLGKLRWESDKGRRYEPTIYPELIKGASEAIHILTEAKDSSSDFDKAFGLLNEASRICFLGFGYDETNMKRLKFEKINPQEKQVFGSSRGMGRAEIDRVKTMWKINLDAGGFDILNFLKHSVFLD